MYIFTSTHKSRDPITNFVVGGALANLFNDTGVVTTSNSAWRRSVVDVLPVSRVQGNSLGLDEKPVVAWKFGHRYVILQLRDALGDVNDGFLSRHGVLM